MKMNKNWIGLLALTGLATACSTPAVKPTETTAAKTAAAPVTPTIPAIKAAAMKPRKRKAGRGLASVDTRTLTVLRQGTGTGVVTSRPSGIDCGTACSMDFMNSRQIRLNAVADTTSTFAGWSMKVCGTDQTCSVYPLPACGTNTECKVKMSDDVTIVAQFDKIGCPTTAPFLCPDGNCALNEAACTASCPSQTPIQCSDGRCVPMESDCANSGCPSGTEPCPANPTVCIPPGGAC